jgi:cell division protein FtsI/penicillin-binding protein 2
MPRGGFVLYGNRRPRRWPWLLGGVLAVAVLVGAGFVAARALLPGGPPDQVLVRDVTAAYLDAWEDEDWEAMAPLVADDEGQAAIDRHRQVHDSLRITQVDFAAGAPVVADDRASVDLEAGWELEGLDGHEYESTVELVRVEVDDAVIEEDPAAQWRIDWSPAVVHPELSEDGRGDRVQVPNPRAPILASDGSPLVTTDEQVVVTVDPGRVVVPDVVTEALEGTPGADAGVVAAAMDSGEPQTAGRLPRAEFDDAAEDLIDTPGLVFTHEVARDLQGPGILRQVVGAVGDITEEQLDELGPPYRAGDTVGQSGIEAANEETLAGEPADIARLVDGNGVATVIAESEAVPPEAVETTLDPRMAEAAEAALGGTGQPAALVAVDVETGELRASVSAPAGGLNRALTARYAPGSTFKVVTAAAVLADGMEPGAAVECPPTISITGRSFRNAGGDGPGTITFDEALRRSCNTAFTRMGVDVGNEGMIEMAETFGFNTEPELGITVPDSRFPEPSDDAELAAASIGQGRVESTPLHMASVAAAIAAGEWRQPVVVRGLEGDTRPLPEGVAGPLQEMMRGVVATGTGDQAQLGGEPVAGKTGSAEFGSGPPFETHAWFAGFRGGTAFAVFVEAGGAGGSVAAPIAAAFLSNLD